VGADATTETEIVTATEIEIDEGLETATTIRRDRLITGEMVVEMMTGATEGEITLVIQLMDTEVHLLPLIATDGTRAPTARQRRL
jgi:hypothetical protein